MTNRILVSWHCVKLNNPLMGTETERKERIMNAWSLFEHVKLNNPLMGTETSSLL